MIVKNYKDLRLSAFTIQCSLELNLKKGREIKKKKELKKKKQ